MTAPRVVLVGPPGAGKTTVAGVLAGGSGLEARDTDADVEADGRQSRSPRSSSRTVSRSSGSSNEPRWPAALAEHAGVLALGGGRSWTQPSRRALAGHTVVFLDVGIADAAGRVGFTKDRPLLMVNPRRSGRR